MWWYKSAEFLKRHWVAIVLALFAALLVGGPSVLAVQALGGQYQGIPFLYQDSELAYLARIHDVLDGHPALGAPVFYEYKDVPAPLPPMGEYAYVALKEITFLPIDDIVVASKFVFPFILFLLAYAAAYLLGSAGVVRRLTALAAASAIIFGLDFVNPPYALSIVKAGSSVLYLSVWSRLVNPITGAILLFAFIGALVLHMRGRKYAWVGLGVTLGLMSGYIFSFALALTSLFIICASLFIEKRTRAACACICALILGGLINAFQLPQFFAAIRSPDEQMFSLRNGLLLTHTPLIDKVLVLTTVVLAITLVVYRKRMKTFGAARDSILIISAFLAAGFVDMNEQILTGRAIWPEHFVQYTVPICYLALSVGISLMVAAYESKTLRRVWQAILVVGIIACFAFGLRTFGSYKAVLPDFADEERVAPALQWLDANTPDDCVVFTVEDPTVEILSDMVPALTHCDDYWSSYVFVGIPEARIEHNYLMRLRFASVTTAQAPAYIHQYNEEYRSVLFQDWKQIFWYSNDPWLISISDRPAIQQYFDALEVKLASDYGQEMKGNFESELKQYKIDYVMWDSEKYPEWNPKAFPFLHQVFEADGVYIYSLQ